MLPSGPSRTAREPGARRVARRRPKGQGEGEGEGVAPCRRCHDFGVRRRCLAWWARPARPLIPPTPPTRLTPPIPDSPRLAFPALLLRLC